jgi:hypothetical protein
MAERTVRIGCASGFWGDSALAAPQLATRGDIGYLVFDYLAEVTMSIMARARQRAPEAGYATDFAAVVMPEIVREVARRGIKVIANAGGVNPGACRDAVAKVAADAGVALKIAVVHGDDLMPRIEALRPRLREMATGEPLPAKLLSANAYLGALPIAAALDAGADIVITGRCVDSAVVLAPLIHAFKWAPDDFDRLAAGSLAGHILECGAQATGGIFTDWDAVERWEDIGYPIAEVSADGSMIVTRPEGTGGLVTTATVAEQMLYEIGDPAAYALPDVVCDFSQVSMEPAGPERVRVSGARGRPPSTQYKVSATYFDGYRLSTTLSVIGFDAAAKARRTGEAVLERTRSMFRARKLGDYRDTLVEALGAEDIFGPHARAQAAREVVLRLSARHDDKRALEILAGEAIAPVTSMAPGTTGYIGGRAKPQQVVRLFSCLVPKAEVPVEMEIDGRRTPVAIPPGRDGAAASAVASTRDRDSSPDTTPTADLVELPLIAVAHGRSGDKGDDCNIAIIARRAEFVPLLRQVLTPEAVAAWFAHLVKGPVERFEAPGVNAFNFLLHEALGGGGMASLRNDPQGKSYAQILLSMPLAVPRAMAERIAQGNPLPTGEGWVRG